MLTEKLRKLCTEYLFCTSWENQNTESNEILNTIILKKYWKLLRLNLVLLNYVKRQFHDFLSAFFLKSWQKV